MGTWDATAFGNDHAADFAGDLDDLEIGHRVAAIRKALIAAADEADYLDSSEGVPAVAAAAIVAAQCPGGSPTDPIYGPEQPIPDLPDDLRALALRALERVLADDSELKDLWDESGSSAEWLSEIEKLRAVLQGR
ncbi:DUF4259 domain-containing protein [Nonomuraea sp. H19]|uniref:DUF4259 domain-containing protein n=1 Tax=Nonomuraea sp. H19 TaxID=3452206 RepID=UPI003F8A8DC1